ncbi:MAG: hypothetical protein U9R79_11620 [Armatimonadota bacterium]|nr:hypothetical protein [Armatimonadota bacterium]
MEGTSDPPARRAGRRGETRDRRLSPGRVLTWLCVGLPALLALALLAERANLPAITPGFDLSTAVIAMIAAGIALTGLATIVVGIRAGDRALRLPLARLRDPAGWAEVTFNARLRAAWLVLLGSGLLGLGIVVLIQRLIPLQ